MADSSTGGYLHPAISLPPEEDVELDLLLAQMVAGISGLPEGRVQLRWQALAAEPDEDWCVLEVTALKLDAGPALMHDASGDGKDVYVRHHEIALLCSFYGPHARHYALQLADGIAVPQNREAIGLRAMAFVSAGEIRAVPDLANQQGTGRYDMTIVLRRKITREYAVLNLLSADTQIAAEGATLIITKASA